MSRIAWLVLCACGVALVATPAFADNPKPAKKADPTEKILDVLAQECVLKEGINVNDAPLLELLQDLSKRYDVNFVIDENSFKAVGRPNIREERPTFSATAVSGLTVHQFLATTLGSLGATYLVKNGAIEIVDTKHAGKLTKSGVSEEEDGRARLNEPLVSAVVKEKPLNEVVTKIAEMYDLTVIVAPQAGDAKTGFVTARLLNTPADKALELLALQCDLRVVRRGNALLITSRDQANELFGEKLDKERQLIEVQKLREAPAKPPEKPPEPKAP
jgi:type II secretory pathway component GspD/PulD (secretin)